MLEKRLKKVKNIKPEKAFLRYLGGNFRQFCVLDGKMLKKEIKSTK
jgi:hypothetical protein